MKEYKDQPQKVVLIGSCELPQMDPQNATKCGVAFLEEAKGDDGLELEKVWVKPLTELHESKEWAERHIVTQETSITNSTALRLFWMTILTKAEAKVKEGVTESERSKALAWLLTPSSLISGKVSYTRGAEPLAPKISVSKAGGSRKRTKSWPPSSLISGKVSSTRGAEPSAPKISVSKAGGSRKRTKSWLKKALCCSGLVMAMVTVLLLAWLEFGRFNQTHAHPMVHTHPTHPTPCPSPAPLPTHPTPRPSPTCVLRPAATASAATTAATTTTTTPTSGGECDRSRPFISGLARVWRAFIPCSFFFRPYRRCHLLSVRI
jgi:hypothetical protein